MAGRSRWERITDITIRVVAAACLVAVLCLGAQHRAAQECFRKYADAQARTTTIRAEAAEADRRAQRELYLDIVNRPRDSISALNSYLRTQEETDRKRAENPPPPPPSAACKG